MNVLALVGPACRQPPRCVPPDDPFMEERSMRRFMMAAACLLALSSNVGCFIPIYSGDPATRTRQLIYTSEDERQILQEWERIWFLDMPSHLSPHRVHGGVI
jgi:hypothetical protein